MVLLDSSREWVHVFANMERRRDVSGWLRDKGVIRANTPNGDHILYGEA